MSKEVPPQDYQQMKLPFSPEVPMHPNLELISPVDTKVVFTYDIAMPSSDETRHLPPITIRTSFDHQLTTSEQIDAVGKKLTEYKVFSERVGQNPSVFWDELDRFSE